MKQWQRMTDIPVHRNPATMNIVNHSTDFPDLDKKLLANSISLWYDSFVVERQHADIAQSVERILGKDEVASSNLAISSMTPRDVVSMAPGVFLISRHANRGAENHARYRSTR